MSGTRFTFVGLAEAVLILVTSAGMFRWFNAFIAACLAVACAAPALAQYSQPLFLEVARDPGRADVPVTARSLALGGLQLGSTGADMSLVNPALLGFGTGTDLTVSFGGLWYSREELITTPNQLPPWDPAREETDRTDSPLGYGAVVSHTGRFAFAVFFDATSRLRHTFTTSQATLAFASSSGFGYEYRGQGTASVDLAAPHIGGSVAVTLVPGRLSIGLALSAIRLDGQVSSEVAMEARTFPPSDSPWTAVGVERDAVDFGAWAPGVVLSAAFRPADWVTLSARWRHEPAFNAERRLTEAPGLSNVSVEEPVEFDLPDSLGLGAAFSLGKTVLGVELLRSQYADVFGPRPAQPFNSACDTLTTVYCPGWAFTGHTTSDATRVAGGVEQSVPAGGSSFLLRVGAGYEQTNTLARSSSDPSRSGGMLPEPPVVSEFEPPREAAAWFSAGLGYRRGPFEVGTGFEAGSSSLRILADLRFQLR